MAVELGHEAVAEAHYLGVRLACGIEVAAALAAAHGQPGERVLEGLLEGEEFHDRKVDIGLEAQPALVGADGIVELHAEAAVDMPHALVVQPRDAEDDLPVRLDHALEDAIFPQHFFFGADGGFEGSEHLFDRLHELGFARIFACGGFDDFGDIRHGFPPLGRRGEPAPLLGKNYITAKKISQELTKSQGKRSPPRLKSTAPVKIGIADGRAAW